MSSLLQMSNADFLQSLSHAQLQEYCKLLQHSNGSETFSSLPSMSPYPTALNQLPNSAIPSPSGTANANDLVGSVPSWRSNPPPGLQQYLAARVIGIFPTSDTFPVCIVCHAVNTFYTFTLFTLFTLLPLFAFSAVGRVNVGIKKRKATRP